MQSINPRWQITNERRKKYANSSPVIYGAKLSTSINRKWYYKTAKVHTSSYNAHRQLKTNVFAFTRVLPLSVLRKNAN
jgi:hypothetical protein